MKKLTFVCKPIRKRDAKGTLVSAGATWREGTQLNRGRMFLGVLILVGAFVTFGLAGMLRSFGIAGLFDAITAGLTIWGIALLFWPATDRELHFGVADWIETPGGVKYQGGVTRWGYKASDVISIEATLPMIPDEDKFRHDVIMVMDDGNVIHMAGDLHPEHAMVVARQLTKALGEVRAAQGSNTFYAFAG